MVVVRLFKVKLILITGSSISKTSNPLLAVSWITKNLSAKFLLFIVVY